MIGLLILIYGGGDLFAYERGRYSVLAEKVDSGIKTEFIVYSRSDIDAKEEVSLNGWKVLSVKRISSDSQNDSKVALLEKEYKSVDDVSKISKNESKKRSESIKIKKSNPPRRANSSKIQQTKKRVTKPSVKHINYCNQVNIYLCKNGNIDNGSEFTEFNDIKSILSSKMNLPEQDIKIELKKVKD